jgi:ribosomal protein L19E
MKPPQPKRGKGRRKGYGFAQAIKAVSHYEQIRKLKESLGLSLQLCGKFYTFRRLEMFRHTVTLKPSIKNRG